MSDKLLSFIKNDVDGELLKNSFVSVYGGNLVSLSVYEGYEKKDNAASVYLSVESVKKLIKNLLCAIDVVEKNGNESELLKS